MIGAFLNALGILLGALTGMALRKPMTVGTQSFFKTGLGAFTIFYGLRLIYENLHGPFAVGLKQLAIAILAIFLGYWLGWLLRLQAMSNRLGHHAAQLITMAQKNPPGPPAAGFVAATLLFCAAPLGLLGSVVDGLEDYFYLLLLKALMDGVAMITFMKIFRWPTALAVLPVFFFINGLSWLVRFETKAWLDAHGVTGEVGLTAGIITCTVSLVIFEVRRVEMANYLPALAVAPLLAYWLV